MSNNIWGGLAGIALIAAYFAPVIVAHFRHVPNQGSVFVIDLFLGWTLVGWVVALAMALRTTTRPPPPLPPAPPYGYPDMRRGRAPRG